MNNGHSHEFVDQLRQAASSYQRHGWSAILYPLKEKYSTETAWYNKRLTPEAIAKISAPSNIGVLTGEASNGLYDMEFDVPESLRATHEKPLATERIYGRPGKRSSHRWYQATDKLAEPRVVWDFPENPNEPNAKTT
jgi:hypothetical protein